MRSIKNKVCKLYIIVNDVLILRCITVIFSNKNHNNNSIKSLGEVDKSHDCSMWLLFVCCTVNKIKEPDEIMRYRRQEAVTQKRFIKFSEEGGS